MTLQAGLTQLESAGPIQLAATDLRQQARQIVDFIADHAPTLALRQSFLARGAVQALLKEHA